MQPPVYSCCHLWHLTIFFWNLDSLGHGKGISILDLPVSGLSYKFWSHIKSIYCLSKNCSYIVQWPLLFNLTTHGKKPASLRKHCFIVTVNTLFYAKLSEIYHACQQITLGKIATIVYPSKAQKNTVFTFQ